MSDTLADSGPKPTGGARATVCRFAGYCQIGGSDTVDGIFDALASRYARHRAASPAVVSRIVERMAAEPAGYLLEIGCGTADYLAALAGPLNDDTIGLDNSPGQLQEARRKHPGVMLTLADARRRLPYAEETFRLCCSVNLIHFIDDLEGYFREVARVVRPGGQVVTVTDSERDLRDRTLSVYFPSTVALEMDRYAHCTPPRIRRAMRAAGWTAVSTDHTRRAYPLRDFLVRATHRAYSILADDRLAPDAYASGIRRLERDLADDPDAQAEELHTYVWGRKPEAPGR
jgi:ubiquinone/menaquinone biosynthesis C-methylase UbiE